MNVTHNLDDLSPEQVELADLLDNEVDALQVKRAAIKAKYPKP